MPSVNSKTSTQEPAKSAFKKLSDALFDMYVEDLKGKHQEEKTWINAYMRAFLRKSNEEMFTREQHIVVNNLYQKMLSEQQAELENARNSFEREAATIRANEMIGYPSELDEAFIEEKTPKKAVPISPTGVFSNLNFDSSDEEISEEFIEEKVPERCMTDAEELMLLEITSRIYSRPADNHTCACKK